MTDEAKRFKESELPTPQMIIKDWWDSQDLQTVANYTADDLRCFSAIKQIFEGGEDEEQFWYACEHVYVSLRNDSRGKLDFAEQHPELKSDQSWIESMQYELVVADVLRTWLNKQSIEWFNEYYQEPK